MQKDLEHCDYIQDSAIENVTGCFLHKPLGTQNTVILVEKESFVKWEVIVHSSDWGSCFRSHIYCHELVNNLAYWVCHKIKGSLWAFWGKVCKRVQQLLQATWRMGESSSDLQDMCHVSLTFWKRYNICLKCKLVSLSEREGEDCWRKAWVKSVKYLCIVRFHGLVTEFHLEKCHSCETVIISLIPSSCKHWTGILGNNLR